MRGFSPADYTLLCYGGAGPMHLAGYSEGLPFKGVATLPWAAAFSSFGCAAVDISHRYQKSTGVLIEDGTSDDMKLMMGQMMLNGGWEELEGLARPISRPKGCPGSRPRSSRSPTYATVSQMDDLEVPSPVSRIDSAEDMDRLIDAFEDLYEKVYAGVAKHPQAGYQIMELGVVASIPKVKPKLVQATPGKERTLGTEATQGEKRSLHGWGMARGHPLSTWTRSGRAMKLPA